MLSITVNGIYQTLHQVRFDRESFYNGRAMLESRLMRGCHKKKKKKKKKKKIEITSSFPLLGCPRHQVENLSLLSRHCLGRGGGNSCELVINLLSPTWHKCLVGIEEILSSQYMTKGHFIMGSNPQIKTHVQLYSEMPAPIGNKCNPMKQV